jgi:hypothetical protein
VNEAVILCEGYHDRDFWAGWLESLGCPKPTPGSVRDTTGQPVSGHGHYGYWTHDRRFIRIVPCHGKTLVLSEARRRVEGRRVEPVLSRLVLCVDPDTPAGTPTALTGLRSADVARMVHTIEPDAAQNPAGDIELDAGATKVSLVRWEVPDDDAPGVPRQQTLERLACSALIAAYPARGPAIAAWLANRPGADATGPKEHAWSHMAGWYADFGCALFYKNLWTDPKVSRELESRLKACGAWRIAEALTA